MPSRGPGRPVGSLNRETVQWSRYVKSAYGSPLENQARIMAMSIPEIARELGCSREEAMARWLRCTEFVLGYTHSEMPRAVAVDVVDGVGGLTDFFAAQVAGALVAQAQEVDGPGASSSSASQADPESAAHRPGAEIVPFPADSSVSTHAASVAAGGGHEQRPGN